MKRAFLLMMIVLLVFGIGVMGCSSGAKAKIDNKELKKEYDNAPAWVLSGSKDDVFSGVGSAIIGKGGMQFARTEAMSNGRSELARQISVKVRSLVNNFSQQAGMGDEQTLDAFSKQVAKLVTDETLAGSRQKDIWISPKSEVFVLMVIDKDAVEASVRRQVIQGYQQNSAKWQEFQAKNANETLDREIEAAFGKQQ
ncbi:MAG: LPP20 family lipoprotein [Desulfobacteraceae bacterium]|nr:LPP20 family lipoprotein [Desulfobacteraceae bacterium]